MQSDSISGSGIFVKKCEDWLTKELKCRKTLMTPSCTAALEMAAILVDINPGDEVIMPSYTFVSTANAFVIRGAKIVFVDIRPDTMNIDETKIEAAITNKTKAIVPVHYAGVSCEMDMIMKIANKNNLYVIEDAAQGMMSKYKDKTLGTIGNIGTYSFHETKNYTSGGEGGLLLINDKRFENRAEIIREKGTNRNQFFRGMIDKYSWVDIGSSYLMNDISAAYLWGNLEKSNEINQFRLKIWHQYYDLLKHLEEKKLIKLPIIPQGNIHNAHMFYIKVKDMGIRTKLILHLKKNAISSAFHYVPLHSAPAGKKFGRFHGNDEFTTPESEKILRLPMYYGLSTLHVSKICKKINDFFA